MGSKRNDPDCLVFGSACSLSDRLLPTYAMLLVLETYLNEK